MASEEASRTRNRRRRSGTARAARTGRAQLARSDSHCQSGSRPAAPRPTAELSTERMVAPFTGRFVTGDDEGSGASLGDGRETSAFGGARPLMYRRELSADIGSWGSSMAEVRCSAAQTPRP